MFKDDLDLVREMVAKYGPARQPIVDVGGLIRPCVASYQKTIDLMAAIEDEFQRGGVKTDAMIAAAQRARYLDIERPLSFLGDYSIENPELPGGLAISDLWTKYNNKDSPKIGTAILLSVLEHVDDPFEAIADLRDVMADDGLVIVSVPWSFPYHAECGQDNWRFSPTGLRKVFERQRIRVQMSMAPLSERVRELSPPVRRWEVIESSWRLDVKAEDGVIDLKTGRAQTIQSCYLVARAS